MVSSSTGSTRARVLVLDDEPEICRLLERILKAEHDVVTCCDPVAALATIDGGERYDLIISDVMMPRMTGLDFLAGVTSADAAQAARLVFLTASVLPEEIEATFVGLPNPVLRKPIGIAALRSFVAEHLGRLTAAGADAPT